MATITQQRMAAVRETIETQCHLPLDLDTLAQQAGFSRWHFLRSFRREFGMTPHQYLLQRRIEKAKALLAYSELSVTQICLAVGFQSLGTFSRTFHRLVGCSPTVHRQCSVEQKQQLYRAIPACFFHMLGFGQVMNDDQSNFGEASTIKLP